MLPSQVIDCHVHIIDPDRFAFSDGPGYRPLPHERGSREQLAKILDANGVSCGLLVQPSGYGRDNAALLDAIAASRGTLRGIAVVDPDASPEELSALKSRGVVGLRLNLIDQDDRMLSDPRLKNLLTETRAMDWWVELHAAGPLLIAALDLFREAGVNTIVEHWGRPDISASVDQPAFRALLRCGREGRTVVKLSAPYRVSALSASFSDLDAFADALLEAFSPERCIWGSDWPFINTPRRPDYPALKMALSRWLTHTIFRLALSS